MRHKPLPNRLFYGDNLDVLRRHVADESVDLIYLDPPFNSNANYNVLFAAKDGHQAAAQIQAFEDTWRWDEAAARQFDETVQAGGRVADVLLAFRAFLGTNDMLAYLAMMAPRLVELHRVLTPTGSLYLHCDPTASHYLKLLLDAVFGPERFLNEIIWKRTGSHGGAKRWGPIHDVILFYAKTDAFVWNRVFQPYEQSYIEEYYRFTAPDGRRFRLVTLTGAGTRTGDSGKPWRGINPTKAGRHWAVPAAALERAYPDVDPSTLSTQQKLELLEQAGLIFWPTKAGGVPQQRRFLDENPGVPVQDVITDIQALSSHAAERLHYPTQKPSELLERIVAASCPEGGVVLDPFCGCGTTIEAAHRLGRHWIGIDITHLSIGLIKRRLRDAYGTDVTYVLHGEPTTVEDAAALAENDKFEFQRWVLALIDAHPEGAPKGSVKKGADRGVDGRLTFHLDAKGKYGTALISVKGGHLKASDVRDLRGTVEREHAAFGVLLSLEAPTKPMRTEAAAAGFFETPWGTFPRLQLLTVEQLLAGERIRYPEVTHGNVSFKRAKRAAPSTGTAPDLFDA